MKPASLSTDPQGTPPPALRSLGSTTVRALGETMFEGGPSPLTEARLANVTERVFSMIDHAGPFVRIGLKFAIFALWLSPMLVGKYFTVLPRLSVSERARVLEALERSRVTNLLLLFVGVRAILTMVYYDDATELAQLGYRATDQTRFTRHLALLSHRNEPPAPLESGVRLREREHDERDSDGLLAVDESGEHRASREDVA